jgi:hypothetical protein
MNRYDNLSLDEMMARDVELFNETNSLDDAIKERMERACLVKLEHTYTILPYSEDRDGQRVGTAIGTFTYQQLTGRTILVRYLSAVRMIGLGRDRAPAWAMRASGVLKRPGQDKAHRGVCNGLYAIKHVWVAASRLDLSTEAEP